MATSHPLVRQLGLKQVLERDRAMAASAVKDRDEAVARADAACRERDLGRAGLIEAQARAARLAERSTQIDDALIAARERWEHLG